MSWGLRNGDSFEAQVWGASFSCLSPPSRRAPYRDVSTAGLTTQRSLRLRDPR